MQRRRTARISWHLAALALSCALAGCGQPAPPTPEVEAQVSIEPPETAPERPNVVLIIVDTLRADRLGAQRNGVPIMPEMAALAAESSQFTQARVQATWTKPSVVSILTGLYPETHKVEFGLQAKRTDGQAMLIDAIAPEITTMAEFFKAAGYATAGFQSNIHLREEYGFARGFDEYHFTKLAPATEITDAALEVARKATRPWFMYLHYFDPHASYEPQEPFFASYGTPPELSGEDRDLLDNNYTAEYYMDRVLHDLGAREERAYGSFTEPGREYIRYLYDSECAYADREVGRLIDGLKSSGPAIVVFTSDHGEEFWEHGSIGHSKTVYDELAHVPLFFHIPGEPPAKSAEPVETIDILPTLAALLDLPPDPHWQGRVLYPLRGIETRPSFARTRGSLRKFKLKHAMVLLGTHKLVVDKAGVIQAFDLAADPAEQHDLSGEAPAWMPKLRALLKGHHEACKGHPLAKVARYVTDLDGQAVDDITAELVAIGYFGEDTDEQTEGEPSQ